MTSHASRRRHKARRLALQALYGWSYTQAPVEAVESDVLQGVDGSAMDLDYFRVLVRGVCRNAARWDDLVRPYLDRDIQELTPIERSILRMAAYELVEQLDVPFQVILNEAIELNKQFGTVAGFKYVNAVLEKVAETVRADEVRRYRASRKR